MNNALDSEKIKAQILEWLSAIRSRRSSYSFRSVQSHLRSVGMPSAAGWTPLIAKYKELNYSDITIDWVHYLDEMREIHRCSVLAGSTAVWLFDADAGDIQKMLSHLKTPAPADSLFATHFPFPIPPDELIAQKFSTSFVAKLATNETDITLIACGKRAFREREQLDPSEIGEEALKEFGNFQELIVVRAGWTQAYDRLVFRPLKNRFEIHLDMCCPLNADELFQLQLAYIRMLKNDMEKALGKNLPWMNTAVNVFPRIATLYNTDDGLVLSLGHATGTKSIKEERMRGQRLDLREELFHKHGIKAIHDTDAFSIKKGWVAPSGRHVPSVFIPGHFSKAGTTSAAVRYAIIENCASVEDFDMVLSHLP